MAADVKNASRQEIPSSDAENPPGSAVAIWLLGLFALLLLAMFSAFCIYCKCQCE